MGDQVIFRGVVEIPSRRVTKRVKEDLTATPSQGAKVPGVPKSFPAYEKTGRGTYLIPRWYYIKNLRRKDDKIVLQEEPLAKRGLRFRGSLYKNQEPGTEDLVRDLSKTHGTMGKGRCGTGKTVIGAYLIAKMKSRKTAVLVDQANLVEQWVEQILAHLPTATISFIMPIDKQKKIMKKYCLPRPDHLTKEDTRGNVIICMAQSVMRRPTRGYTQQDAFHVSLLIVDEAHKFSAPRFCKAIFHFSFRYSTSLTATDKRRDGLDWIFRSVLGDSIVQLAGKRMNPVVVPLDIETGTKIQVRDHELRYCVRKRKTTTPWKCLIGCEGLPCPSLRGGRNVINYTDLYLRLANDRMYNDELSKVIQLVYETGHHTIIFSKYKDHLTNLRNRAIESGIPECDTSLYFGGMDKDECMKPQLTFATYGVAKHGLDAPWKSAEILAIPVTEVEQIAGRIERVMEGKPQPVILDIVVSSVGFFIGQWKARLKFYKGAAYGIRRGSFEDARNALCGGLARKAKPAARKACRA